jgi:hypothetical protein
MTKDLKYNLTVIMKNQEEKHNEILNLIKKQNHHQYTTIVPRLNTKPSTYITIPTLDVIPTQRQNRTPKIQQM